MLRGLTITLLAACGIIATVPRVAVAEDAFEKAGAPIVIAQAQVHAVKRIDARESLAALPKSASRIAAAAADIPAKPDTDVTGSDEETNSLITTSIPDTEDGGKRALEFSGRTGPKLRIGMREKKVRFALNFKLVDDVFFAPAYRLAIARGDFQNPNGYTAHSVFFGVRFKFDSGAP